MIPASTITPPDWMIAPATVAILNALQDAGAAPQILFVGGCVRNTLMGRPVDDLDLATQHTPEIVTRRLEAAGIKVVPTGIAHGTLTAVVGKKAFEITTLRRDVETDGRRAVVAFTDDWAEDAARRDFTINTLLADGRGNIYDPLRCGLGDLAARRVVFAGDAGTRIAEDYLRILRFFRFHGLYGAGAPDPAALAACRAAADKVPSLSRERITQEFLKILMAGNAPEILRIMFGCNVIPDLAHPSYDETVLDALIRLQDQAAMPSVAARLACLAGGEAGHLRIFEKYLIFSKALYNDLEALFQAIESPAGPRERLYRYGRAVGAQSVLLRAASRGTTPGDRDLAVLRDGTIPVFPLGGDDLLVLGVAGGPFLGGVLKAVETWWVEQDFQPGHAACVDRARGLI